MFKFKFNLFFRTLLIAHVKKRAYNNFFNENILNCGSSLNPKEPHGTPSNKQIKGIINKFITLHPLEPNRYTQTNLKDTQTNPKDAETNPKEPHKNLNKAQGTPRIP